jgi:hypothetical protein
MSKHDAPRPARARYGHSGSGGGHQDQPERKDDDWTSRQGGHQSRPHGRDPEPIHPDTARAPTSRPSASAIGTNTQGELRGIGEGADRVERELEQEGFRPTAGDIPDADE